MKKEKLEKEIKTTKENIKKDSKNNKVNFIQIIKHIKNYGQIALSLNYILLFLLVLCSAITYGVIYIFTFQYPLELSFENLLILGFSNICIILLTIIFIYMLIEAIIAFSTMTTKTALDRILKIIIIAVIILMQSVIFFILAYINHFVRPINLIILASFIIFILLSIQSLKQKIKHSEVRIIWLTMSIACFLFSNIGIYEKTGLGDYSATIIVDKNNFIKDIVDIEDKKEKYTKNYHYKGDHIELKDVKVLSTLGDIAYVELCSENMEIEKTLGDCRKSIRVEFIKKDIHIIRDGKKQDVANSEDGSDKTNNKMNKI